MVKKVLSDIDTSDYRADMVRAFGKIVRRKFKSYDRKMKNAS
jgi:hypothetical protein